MRKTLAVGALMLGMALSPLPAAAQFSGDVIKLGVLTDMSSLYADINGPGAVAAVRLAVEEYGGTVAGKKIEVVIADVQNKADVAANISGRWYDVDGVDAIFGAGGS